MRRTLALLLCLLLALTGCAPSTQPAPQPEEPSPAAESETPVESESPAEPEQPQAEDTPQPALSKAEHRGLQTWRDAAKQAGKIIGDHLGVHVEDWRKTFYASSTEDTASSKRVVFHRIRKSLVERGELTVNDDFYFRAGFTAELEEAELMGRE